MSEPTVIYNPATGEYYGATRPVVMGPRQGATVFPTPDLAKRVCRMLNQYRDVRLFIEPAAAAMVPS